MSRRNSVSSRAPIDPAVLVAPPEPPPDIAVVIFSETPEKSIAVSAPSVSFAFKRAPYIMLKNPSKK